MSALLLIPVLGAVFLIARMVVKSRPAMSPQEAAAAVETGIAVLVDVREPAEWTGGVARVAVLLPLSDLRGPRKRWTPFLEKNRSKRILLYCQSGMRSGMAASILKAEGFEAANMGTFSNWRANGLPVRTP
jgi:rhodanese-related sulfurtransferase